MKKSTGLGMAIAVGLCAGVVFGLFVDDITLGIGLGLALGIAIHGVGAARVGDDRKR